jgi:uncharacterized membrane protein YhaH (DUF805 family)
LIRARLVTSDTIGRRDFVIAGLLLFAVKHNLDRLIALVVFRTEWNIFHYLMPISAHGVPANRTAFLLTMLATSLPFAALGVWFTAKRLRDAGLSPLLALLFFLPIGNLLFFAVLSVLPAAREQSSGAAAGTPARRRFLERICPHSASGSAFVSVVGTALVFVPLIAIAVGLFETYGWVTFVGFPFAQGMVAAIVYGVHQPRRLAGCLGVAALTVAVDGILLLVFALEGIFCIVMAAPIAIVLALLGGAVGYIVQAECRARHGLPSATAALIVALPFLTAMESAAKPEASLLKVTTVIEIDAAPEVVWNHVVTFADLPAPKEWIFRLGIAYPTHATIEGSGPGAIRKCAFSTGSFIEPVTVWDEPRLLRFSVTENPAPMQEWTPYDEIHPPHLDGFLASQSGQFLLEPMSGGRTRLSGTTWYRHHMFPESYWQIWSDKIIHTIHLRVLNHIKSLAEASAS